MSFYDSHSTGNTTLDFINTNDFNSNLPQQQQQPFYDGSNNFNSFNNDSNFNMNGSNNSQMFLPSGMMSSSSGIISGGSHQHGSSNNMMMSGGFGSSGVSSGQTGFEDEPPLLEELGINFDQILAKTRQVLHPLRPADQHIMDDTDLAGPLIFVVLFGCFLLLSGKIHFGSIYGVAVLGCLAMYSILNLMSENGASLACIISVLGYCLLPMVILSSVSVILSLQGIIGLILTIATVIWCSFSASSIFTAALTLKEQFLLVIYPCLLLYGLFALMTVF